jgi:hypothetical protein
MFGVAGLLIAVAGGGVSYLAERFPTHIEALQTGAGFLLLGGFALIGCALPAAI